MKVGLRTALYKMAFGWGFGKYGQLGNGKLGNFEMPQSFKLPPGALPTQITAGAHFTLVLTRKRHPKSVGVPPGVPTHTLFACGWGKYGRLGTGSTEDQPLPIEVRLPSKECASVSAGHWHAGCLMEDGDVYLWGYNKSCMLGISESELSDTSRSAFVISPILLPTMVRFKFLACGYNYTYAVSTEGKAYSWGLGRSGVLGHGDNDNRTEPHLLTTLREENFVKVACGYSHAALVAANGHLYAVGSGESGALGLGKNKHDRNTPTLVQFGVSKEQEAEVEGSGGDRDTEVHVRDASCSQGEHHPHMLCCTAEGEAWSWGDGYKGKLGHGTQESCDIPHKIDTVHFLSQKVCQVNIFYPRDISSVCLFLVNICRFSKFTNSVFVLYAGGVWRYTQCSQDRCG